MRDDEAFLRAIIDQPDDDLPRLIYADYLDEHGDGERAELIRVQCEMARNLADSRRIAQLVVRSEQLLRAHRCDWLGPLAEWADDCFFLRGFVEQISVSAAAFLAHADSIWRWAPVRWLTLQGDAWEVIDKLAAAPHLNHLSRMSLKNNHLDSADAAILLKSPHLARLAELDLSANRLDTYALDALAGCATLPNLQCLKLSENDVTSAGVIALTESPHRRGLTGLYVEVANIGAAGVEALAFGDGLPRLQALDLSGNRIGRRGLRALIHSSGLRSVRRLALRNLRLSRDVRAALRHRYGGSCEF